MDVSQRTICLVLLLLPVPLSHSACIMFNILLHNNINLAEPYENRYTHQIASIVRCTCTGRNQPAGSGPGTCSAKKVTMDDQD